VPSTLLRTKANAVHAGLSQLLQHSKVLTSSLLDNSSLSQSNSLSTAQLPTVVATVETWVLLSITPKTRLLFSQKIAIPTLLLTRAAKLTDLESSELLATLMFPKIEHNLKLLLPRPPSQLPLKLINNPSNNTLVESSTTIAVEPILITESSSSDTETKTVKTTGS
jgi:hypothetical protein